MSYTEELITPLETTRVVVNGIEVDVLRSATAEQQAFFIAKGLEALIEEFNINIFAPDARYLRQISRDHKSMRKGKKAYELLLKLLVISSIEKLIDRETLSRIKNRVESLNIVFAGHESAKHHKFLYDYFSCRDYIYRKNTEIPIKGHNN